MSQVAALFPRQRVPLAERFWSKVDKDGPVPSHRPELGPCWVWTASTNRKGYGQIMCAHPLGKRPQIAHRVAWLLTHGTWPELCVLHACDNPACVRPAHLFLGTKADNNRDMWAKGRGVSHRFTRETSAIAAKGLPRGDAHYSRTNPERLARGERHPRTTITTDQVIALRAERSQGIALRVLAEKYGIRECSVSAIVKRRNWKHVP